MQARLGLLCYPWLQDQPSGMETESLTWRRPLGCSQAPRLPCCLRGRERAAGALVSKPLVEGPTCPPGPTACSEASGSVSLGHPHADPGVRVGSETTSQSRQPRPQRRGWWCGSLTSQQGWGDESEVAQSCPTLSDPMDYSPPGSSIHGIFQARILEWGAIAFSQGSPYVLPKS